MNKAETKQLEQIKVFIAAGMKDTAARSLSALIRSTLRRTTAHELHRFAVEHEIYIHPEFII